MSIFYLSPFTRPFIAYTSVLVFAVCGYINGFMTSRMLKFFGCDVDWKQSAKYSAGFFPLYVLVMLFMGDIAEWIAASSAAIPFFEGGIYYFLWWAIDGAFAAYGAM